jgi:hypothetical protein
MNRHGRNSLAIVEPTNKECKIPLRTSRIAPFKALCRSSMDVCCQFPNGSTQRQPCRNGTLDRNLLLLKPSTSSPLEETYGFNLSLHGDAESNGTVAQRDFCRPLEATRGARRRGTVSKTASKGWYTNNDDGLAVLYFDGNDGFVVPPLTTVKAEEVWYNPFNFTWKKSGALNGGSLDDCNVTEDSDTGGTTLTLKSGVAASIDTIAKTTTLVGVLEACYSLKATWRSLCFLLS